ncbi:protein disabled isoform X2 [Amyelois transitella]|uniref:protein disabled isoform X2 n=1 Tax=Amyelois transitella TaxID=680683 RepID=UPI00298F88EA|nr:protein disabled isoform X2 [Amyelois transitella]XP_060805577.1 protein disabled isoform X2 [Amyelois transitella]
MQVCHFQHLLRQFDKNEPGRFLGEGVSFRAKLIGVLEVPEARGDRMCQEALADLKMAIRAAGEHKQRIQVHVAIDGLRLRDDKTGDSLYHHPVHKISFIAQDMTDSRAFGYIFGSPDTGHRFFGIKTDKAASQVVIAMRDLFQVVFELKKKEVELAKQQLEGKTVTSSLVRHAPAVEPKAKIITSVGESSSTKTTEANAEGGVAELVDLEQELSSLRRGLTQVEGLTPSTDPFGDSFIMPSSQKGLLPPPPAGAASRGRSTPGARALSPGKASASSLTSASSHTLPFDLTAANEFETITNAIENLVDPPVSQPAAAAPSLGYDVFTELDPLGTGRSKPYVDKKLFFQELKNPPKKVLKDLVQPQNILSDPPLTTELADYGPATTMTSLTRHSGGSVTVAKPLFSGNLFAADPFAETDPFDNTDPFDSFKDDPFTSMQEFPRVTRAEEIKGRFGRESDKTESAEKNVFNGPLQVSLPPEPVPKSPRLQRQSTDTSITPTARPRAAGPPPGSSPPPPLPPKKPADVAAARPPPRPPHDEPPDGAPPARSLSPAAPGPPLPRPARKKEPLADRSTKPRLSSASASAATNSSEEEYLTPAPPPLPAARRFDITLSQLLTCTMDELAARLRVPATTLSSMTLPQLTEYLRSYLAADNDRARINVDPSFRTEKEKPITIPSTITIPEKPAPSAPSMPEFQTQFEDNFAPTTEPDTFVANFDDFDKKANASYDRYAAFREIQEQELIAKSILDPDPMPETESKQDYDEKEELTAINDLMRANEQKEIEAKETSKSPLKSLDELTLDSFNMFRNSVSPKPSQIDAKIDDIKSVMKTLQIEKTRRSISPRDNGNVDTKQEDTSDVTHITQRNNDRYAALREITITEPPQDEFESLPPEVPKERKKSDEKSDGFDNSDFFDCIDNSSLSFSHVEDAFRKSPMIVKEREEEKKVEVEKKEIQVELTPMRKLQPPARLSTESISDVASGSSPEIKEAGGGAGAGGRARWAALGRASPWSSDSEPRARRGRAVHTSSSSRDVSPWDEEPNTAPRGPLRHRDSRHNSSGSRECLDSGSGREKDKLRDKRDRSDRDLSRDGRDSGRDRRDSGSGRDRRDSKEREHRRERRSRERDGDGWERGYRERGYRDCRAREPGKDYRDKERHRKPRHSYDEDDYSDGCGSGRSSPRDRWPDQRWRRDERNYGSLGWRETRRRAELRQSEDPSDRRYGSTLGWPSRRYGTGSWRETERETRDVRETRDIRETREGRETREARRRARREMREARESRDRRDNRFSNDFSPRDRDHPSPFDNDFHDTPNSANKKRTPYSSLEGTRFAFESEPSPVSGGSSRAHAESPAARFRFDSDSVSPRSMFEDDFAPRGRTASIAEEDESDVPPLRTKPQQAHKDIKKSESVNIFTRESDPFEGDAFFACTGSDRAARRENWPSDFQGFDHA